MSINEIKAKMWEVELLGEDLCGLNEVLSICLSTVLLLCMVATLSACGNNKSKGAKKYGYDHTDLENMITFVSSQAENSSAEITTKAETLLTDLGETFDTYSNNKTKITEFYTNSLANSDALFAALKTVTADYYVNTVVAVVIPK